MKKLFLYITIIFAIFGTSYALGYNKFNIKSESSEEEKRSCIEEFARIAKQKTENEDVFANNKKDKYIIGAKNGNVVVYLNTLDNVFDYTGINLNSVKYNDEAIYNEILNYIVMYNKEDVYKFLEAISN